MAFAAGVNLDRRRALTDRGIGANTRSVAKDGEEQNHAPSDAMEGGSHAGTLSLRLDFLDSQAKDSILVGEHSAHSVCEVITAGEVLSICFLLSSVSSTV